MKSQPSNHPTIQPSNYLLIGHSCHDKTSSGFTLGGAVSYSGIAAKKLGAEPAILTSVGNDFLFHKIFEKEKIPFHIKSAEQTTIFENIYSEEKRTQYIHAKAANIFVNDIPYFLRNPKIVQCSPICDEVDFEILSYFPGVLVGATIQGWLRQWNKSGLVSPKKINWSKLSAADVVIFSDEDIRGFEEYLPEIISHVKIVAMTQGVDGVNIWEKGTRFHFPSYPTQVVDATGAGDVFAAAFLIRLSQTENISKAARFANAAASLSVGGHGFDNLKSWEEIIRIVN